MSVLGDAAPPEVTVPPEVADTLKVLSNKAMDLRDELAKYDG